jgi:hypothetical protein
MFWVEGILGRMVGKQHTYFIFWMAFSLYKCYEVFINEKSKIIILIGYLLIHLNVLLYLVVGKFKNIIIGAVNYDDLDDHDIADKTFVYKEPAAYKSFFR